MDDTQLAARDREEERLRCEIQRGPSWGGAFLALVGLIAVGYGLWALWGWLTAGAGR